MDGIVRAIYNIFTERFCRTIKYEYVYINRSKGGCELYIELEEYVKFYNNESPHDSLGKSSPVMRYNPKDSIKF